MVITFKALSKLSKRDRELYAQCQGECRICFYEDGCALAKKMNKLIKGGEA